MANSTDRLSVDPLRLATWQGLMQIATDDMAQMQQSAFEVGLWSLPCPLACATLAYRANSWQKRATYTALATITALFSAANLSLSWKLR